jgi:ABC-type polysaccharide/polyol phosphate export permease
VHDWGFWGAARAAELCLDLPAPAAETCHDNPVRGLKEAKVLQDAIPIDTAPPRRAPLELELWRHRRLVALFVRRELRARYAGSALGIFWSVILPLVMLALYIVVFSTLMPRSGRLPFRSATAEYAVFLCPALIAWNWLLEALSSATGSIVANAAVIRKTVFPLAILPVVSVLASAVAYVVGMIAFVIFLIVLGHAWWGLLVWLPFLALVELALLAGPAYFLATLNVFVRDTGQVLFALLQILFWATPVVYPADVITKALPVSEWWFRLNPVARLMDAYRQVIILTRAPDLETVLYLAIWAVLLYHAGRSAFMRARGRFADEV